MITIIAFLTSDNKNSSIEAEKPFLTSYLFKALIIRLWFAGRSESYVLRSPLMAFIKYSMYVDVPMFVVAPEIVVWQKRSHAFSTVHYDRECQTL